MTSNSTTSGMNTPPCVEGRGLPANPQVMDSRGPFSWDQRLAAVISGVGSPPILASVAVGLTAVERSGPHAWIWVIVYLLLGVLSPFSYVVWLVKRGYVTDVDVQLRKQRAQPLLITILCTGVAWLVLALAGAPTEMTLVAGAIWFQVVVIFAITLRWKISVHSATAAGAATMVWALLGTPVPLLLVVPLVAWSRVRLRRHTVVQTVAGALLGFAVFLTATALMPSG